MGGAGAFAVVVGLLLGNGFPGGFLIAISGFDCDVTERFLVEGGSGGREWWDEPHPFTVWFASCVLFVSAELDEFMADVVVISHFDASLIEGVQDGFVEHEHCFIAP